jgi:transposase
VMDNLNVHKGAQVRAIIEGAGCALVYLPAYSPDFSPIEGAYSKVKARVRRAGRRVQDELEGAIGEAVEAVTASDARGWFAPCGYRLPDLSNENCARNSAGRAAVAPARRRIAAPPSHDRAAR